MRSLATAVVGLVLVALLGACGRLDVSSASPAQTSTTASAPSTAPASTSAAATTTPSPSPAVQPPAPVPIGKPTTFSGSGDAILPITKPVGATAVIARITGNAAGHNFDVRAIDGAQDRLVATTSPYAGSTVLDAAGTTTRQLRVHAAGPWSITLSDVRSAPSFTIGYRGTGDAVILHAEAGGTGPVQAQGAGTPFSVRTYRAGRVADLVKVTGPWTGTVHWPAGYALVAVRAVGPWSIAVIHRG